MGEKQARPQQASQGKGALLAAATAGVVAVLMTYLLEYLTPLTSSTVPLVLGVAAGIIVSRQHARRHGVRR